MFVVCVTIHVLPDHVAAFVEATRANAEGTRRELKNVRYDVLRATDDPTRFCLYEVYTDESGFREHQSTKHYLAWRDAVAPMMASPRNAARYTSVFPDPWE
ncbi:MAG: antibiotic biosynthesis monooxygenase [Polyangiaceae bacterium]|nr:antibiotic biosynthesis monooxygenase [Polyangiaceae bacterium]